MATLQVRGPDFSNIKQQALEDAKKMEASVADQCAKDGKDPPPYRLNELIGKGSFGRVYKATDMKTKMMVAIKIIDIEESDTASPKNADTFKEFMAEVNALKLLSDSGARNINYVIDALPVGQAMWMITEYCAGGSVATLMRPTAPGGLQEKWIVPILREVGEAIFWVHRQGIIHRDIKCANVLITESGSVQLCDFGVAGVIETKFDKRTTFIGTPHWMAPELFDQGKSYGTEVDIWAFGCLVYEIASGLPPNVMAGFDIPSLGNHLKTHAPRLDGDQYSEQLKSLVAFCLVEDPQHRPTIEQVQSHPYIANTAQRYPSSSLSMLVKGFKMWESQGGSRKSLFNPGGAQPPPSFDFSDLSSTALGNDEWNFSTTVAFDQQVFQAPDAQAVFDVYGTKVDFDPNEMMRPSKPKGRRRPPPQQLAAMKVPLEKVFDPNTISTYDENSRAYYGKLMPPPPPSEPPSTSDLPLRDDSTSSADVRESLIDLDASLDGGDLSNFVDMNTIRAGGSRITIDYSADPDDHDYNKAPNSDPADLNVNRRTQDWKFPSMGPASANPEMSRFPFNEAAAIASANNNNNNNNGPTSARPGLPHLATEPTFSNNNYGPAADLAVPRPSTQTGMRESVNSLIDLDMSTHTGVRESVSSLIDLDMSMPAPAPEPTRPSTANSDAASVTGSEMGLANPFHLERHASLYVPSSNREPSIYVSDDSDFAAAIPKGGSDDFTNGLAGLAITENNINNVNNNNNDFSSRPGSAMSQHRAHPNGNLSIGSSVGSEMSQQPWRLETAGYNQASAEYHQMQQQQQHQHQYNQSNDSSSSMMEDPEFLTPQNTRGPFSNHYNGGGSTTASTSESWRGTTLRGMEMPPPPVAPSLDVMQGQANAEQVKQELRRLTMSLGEHLNFMNEHLSSLPARHSGAAAAGGGSTMRGSMMFEGPAEGMGGPEGSI